MTMALSPAKTRSIMMTWRSAVTSFEIKLEHGRQFWLLMGLRDPGLLSELIGYDYRTGSADTDRTRSLVEDR